MGLEGSVHTQRFPEPDDLTAGLPDAQRKRLDNWERLMEVRQAVLKSLETARREKFIGAPLEARVDLAADGEIYPLLQEYSRELPAVFIVSQVTVSNHESAGLAVKVARADGVKCERCWKYSTDVGSHPDLPAICGACVAAVIEMQKDNS